MVETTPSGDNPMLVDLLAVIAAALAVDRVVVDDDGVVPVDDALGSWLVRAGRRLGPSPVSVVGDLLHDTRFGDHPSGTGVPSLRFVAAVRLCRHDDVPVRRLIVGAAAPRPVDDDLIELLARCGRLVAGLRGAS